MSPPVLTPLDALLTWLAKASEATCRPLAQELDEDSCIGDTTLGLSEIRTYDASGHELGRLLLETIGWLREPSEALAILYQRVHGQAPPMTEAGEVQRGMVLGVPVRQPNQERAWAQWTVMPWPGMTASWEGVGAVFADCPWCALVAVAKAAQARRPT